MQKIKVFAAFKEFFDEEFELPFPVKTVDELKFALEKLNPACAQLLVSARFAINHQFINEDRPITSNEAIYIIPPSGGG